MISVIIPVYNEEKKIKGVINKIPSLVKEVIVVDDGSTDNTAKIAKKSGAKVIKHKKNQGKGLALRTGGLAAKGNILVFLDGDGQHNPKHIPRLVKPILDKNADFVIGNRFYKGYRGTPKYRIITNTLTKKCISFIIGKNIEDPLSGYRAMKSEVFHNIELKKARFETEVEMLNKVARQGYIIKEVPISLVYADETSHIRKRDNLRLSLNILFDIFKTLLKQNR